VGVVIKELPKRSHIHRLRITISNATSIPPSGIIPESGLCVEVLITEYSVGSAVIARVVGSRVAGFVKSFSGTVVTYCGFTGVFIDAFDCTLGVDFIDVENAYTVLSPVATTNEPSLLIAI